jgi:GR25 family glycosyltransferase involved in LPS biosynthesis
MITNTPPIYIINLKDKETNLFRTLRELRKTNLFNDIIIKEACDIKKAKEECFKYITNKACNNINNNLTSLNILPTWGSVGCAISHISCWEDMISKNFNYAIICEDDIKINNINFFKFCYYEAINKIKHSDYDNIFDIILFNAKLGASYSGYDDNIINQVYSTFTNTSFYLLNLKAAYKLLKMLPITHQIDIEIAKNIFNLKLNIYNCTSSSITNYDHQSTVQYYFLKKDKLISLLKNILPVELIEKIYFFLPIKENLNDNNNSGYEYGY